MSATRVLGAVSGVLLLAVAGCSGEDSAAATSPPVTSGTTATRSTPAAAPVPAVGEEWLAYQDSTFRIQLVRPNGSDEHALDTVSTGPEDNPDWSPDGTRLTFVGSGDQAGSNAGLWVIGTDGSGLTRVVSCETPCEYLDDPAWSPDGSQIAYSRMQPHGQTGGTLETVEVGTGRTRTLLSAKAGEFFSGVRYAPSGKALVVEWVLATPKDHEDIKGVTLARVDLTKTPPTVKRLTPPAVFAQTPDWSPTGDLIVYAALPKAGSSANDLYLVRPDGGAPRRLTNLVAAGSGALYPDFTEDGSAVVFLGADASGKPRFRVVDLATGAVSPALGGLVAGVHPRSRPVP